MARASENTVTRWTRGKSVLTLWHPPGEIVYGAMTGFYWKELVPPFLDYMNDIIATQRVRTYSDWSEMTGYDPETRKQLTAWQKVHDKEVIEARLCVRSAIVSLGVTAANIVLGGQLRVTSDRASFYHELSAVAQPLGFADRVRALAGGDLKPFSIIDEQVA